MELQITIQGVTKGVKFTKKQAEIMQRIIDGEKIKMQPNGPLVWDREGYEEIVNFRAFSFAVWAIRDAFGYDVYDTSFTDNFFVK